MAIDSATTTPAAPDARPIARSQLRVAAWMHKLTQNGSSACVVIRRPALRHLRWHRGMVLVVEILSDDTLRVRRATAEDLISGPAREFALPVDLGAAR